MYRLGHYADEVKRYIEGTIQANTAEIRRLATEVFTSIRDGEGLWHIFGSGHSALVADEMFHRAGGLAAVNSWTDVSLSPLVSPRENREGERREGVAGQHIHRQSIRAGEVLVIISNSGVNPFSVDLALAAKGGGLKVWALTSVAHSKAVKSRHSSGRRLFEVVDGVLDTRLPLGDATINHVSAQGALASGAASLVIGATVLHEVEQSIVAQFIDHQLEPPVYTSANVPGGDIRNQSLESRYGGRITRLRA